MDKYYHTTKYEYLDDISELGLIPQIGERSTSVGDEKKAVFVSKNEISAVLMFFSMKWFYESHKNNEDELIATIESTILYYNKLIEKRKNQRFGLFRGNIEELEKRREDAVQSLSKAKIMCGYSSFEEYFGEGVYLCINDLPNVKYNHPDIHNCWVENAIIPEDINVVMLKNKETEELIDDKYKVINYFMANIPVEVLFREYKETIGIEDDRYTSHDTLTYLLNYYSNNEEEFNLLRSNYELVEMPIKEYINYKNGEKSAGCKA